LEDARVETWDVFFSDAKKFLSEIKTRKITGVHYYLNGIVTSSEMNLQTKLESLLSGVINIAVQGELSCSNTEEVIGDPDFVFTQDGVLKAVGELRTWWDFPFCDLVDGYETSIKVKTCVAQIYGYMTFNSLR
jgi:hypothetical protein